jgi:SulP family sulfate permease
VNDLINAWKVKKIDALVLIVTFLCTMFIGMEIGIGLGVIAAIAAFIFNHGSSKLEVMGRIPGSTKYAPLRTYPEAVIPYHVLVVKQYEELSYINAEMFKDKIISLISNYKYEVKALVLDAAAIGYIDSTILNIFTEVCFS